MQERSIVAAPPAPSAGGVISSYTVTVQPLKHSFEAPAGQSLLQAAEAAGLVLPSSCRNGTCRSCLCQRLSGETVHRIEWPGLSPDEKADGWILPCVAEARSNLVLHMPEAYASFED